MATLPDTTCTVTTFPNLPAYETGEGERYTTVTEGTSNALRFDIGKPTYVPYHWGEWKYVTLPSVGFNIVSEIAKEKEVREEMRGLYRVLAVDYKNDEVVVDKEVIASSNEAAKLKALAPVVDKYDLDDLDVKAIKVMDVRKKPEPQRVIVEK